MKMSIDNYYKRHSYSWGRIKESFCFSKGMTIGVNICLICSIGFDRRARSKWIMR